MPSEAKIAEVARLAERLQKSRLALFTDFRGLRAQEMGGLRLKLRAQGIDYQVVKNTLVIRALEQVGRGEGKKLLLGPTAIAFGYGEEASTAKGMAEALRSLKALRLQGGLLGERVLTAAEVLSLATLPPREVVLANLLGGMQAPAARLLGVLQASLAGLARLLQARASQLAQTQPKEAQTQAQTQAQT